MEIPSPDDVRRQEQELFEQKSREYLAKFENIVASKIEKAIPQNLHSVDATLYLSDPTDPEAAFAKQGLQLLVEELNNREY